MIKIYSYFVESMNIENVSCIISCHIFLLQESLGDEVMKMGNDEIISRTRLLDNEIKVNKIFVVMILI